VERSRLPSVLLMTMVTGWSRHACPASNIFASGGDIGENLLLLLLLRLLALSLTVALVLVSLAALRSRADNDPVLEVPSPRTSLLTYCNIARRRPSA
jgi:hypothetical protein